METPLRDLIRTMPKAEVHLHLDGSLRIDTALELAASRGIDAPRDRAGMTAALVAPMPCRSQAELLRTFDLPIALMQDAEAIERIASDMVQDKAAERVRYADGEPLALDRSALALDAAQRRAFLRGDLTQGSLYGLLEALCGVRITGGSEQLRAVTCNQAERRLLRPGRGEGVFEVERIAYAAGRPVEWRRSLVRGRGYVLGATWGMLPPASRG